MKRSIAIGSLATTVVALMLADTLLVTEAEAVLGVRRRTAVRTAVVVHAADEAQQSQSASSQAAAPPPQAAPAPPPAPAPAPPPAPQGGAQPLGTVVTSLPAGCAPTAVGGVQYYHCGGSYYRAAFQGSQLVYVTVQP